MSFPQSFSHSRKPNYNKNIINQTFNKHNRIKSLYICNLLNIRAPVPGHGKMFGAIVDYCLFNFIPSQFSECDCIFD